MPWVARVDDVHDVSLSRGTTAERSRHGHERGHMMALYAAPIYSRLKPFHKRRNIFTKLIESTGTQLVKMAKLVRDVSGTENQV